MTSAGQFVAVFFQSFKVFQTLKISGCDACKTDLHIGLDRLNQTIQQSRQRQHHA